MKMVWLCTLSLACLCLAACDNEPAELEALPTPMTLTADAIGYYCRMGLTEHSGPKAQMFLSGRDEPIWFSQVRDAVIYLRSPEELLKARAVFVNDMAVAETWRNPGVTNWIDLRTAFLVIDSERTGGMGAAEVIPFGSESAARSFVSQYGGRIVDIEEIPDTYVFGPAEA